MLEYCHEEETDCWVPILGAFPSDRIPTATKDVKVHFFINSNQYLSIIPANSGNFLKLLRMSVFPRYAFSASTGKKLYLLPSHVSSLAFASIIRYGNKIERLVVLRLAKMRHPLFPVLCFRIKGCTSFPRTDIDCGATTCGELVTST